MQSIGVIRAFKLEARRKSALLRLYRIEEDGSETLEATSAPVTMGAAAAICKLFKAPFSLRPDLESLKRVFQAYGQTAWAGFTAMNAYTAVQQACLQHDLHRARSLLVIITLSLDSNIVDTISQVLNVIHRQAAASIETGLLVAYDPDLQGEVKVEMLLMGL